jgi:CRISPR-associated exonuclease Cas4
MPYSEDDLLPLSALQHLAFCERQWGLIHLEQQWSENRLTAEGRQLHERAHEGADETRGGIRICRGLRLRSLRLGLIGAADVVEFRPSSGVGAVPYPIEYKHGRPKPGHWDEVQLCAQALCLEEMLHCNISEGALFYGQPRRRMDVQFGAELRAETEHLAERLHQLQQAGVTPPPIEAPHCTNCSLQEVCMPQMSTRKHGALAYVARSVAQVLKEG